MRIIILLLFSLSLFGAQKRALITGVTGQDGSYLAEFLLEKGYEVHGIKRRSSSPNTARVDQIYEGPELIHRSFILHYGDLTDMSCLVRILTEVKPHEIYNLGAQSHVKVSFEIPEYTAEVNGIGTLRLVEAIRWLGWEHKVKLYQASTSELYGLVQEDVQSEKTPFYPRSPYGISKLFAYWTVINYRESYDIFAVNGVLFNHESPRRGQTFVSKKITEAACRIKLGLQDCLYLGNLDAIRDWGYAKDYVEAMWLMLQQDDPQDFVIATGEVHSVRDFVEIAFQQLGITIEWQGEGLEEVGMHADTKEVIVRVDSRYFRPSEVDYLHGDYSKAKKILGWKPKTSFCELVKIMVDSDWKKIYEASRRI